MKSKCIKDINLQPESIKLSGKNIGNTLLDIRIGKDFLEKSPITEARNVFMVA